MAFAGFGAFPQLLLWHLLEACIDSGSQRAMFHFPQFHSPQESNKRIYSGMVFSRIQPGSSSSMFLKSGTRKGHKGRDADFGIMHRVGYLYIHYQLLLKSEST